MATTSAWEAYFNDGVLRLAYTAYTRVRLVMHLGHCVSVALYYVVSCETGEGTAQHLEGTRQSVSIPKAIYPRSGDEDFWTCRIHIWIMSFQRSNEWSQPGPRHVEKLNNILITIPKLRRDPDV